MCSYRNVISHSQVAAAIPIAIQKSFVLPYAIHEVLSVDVGISVPFMFKAYRRLNLQ